MANKVIAEVILRTAQGTSILDATEGITTKSLEQYRVDKKVLDEATRRFQQLGFEVPRTGPTGIAITGDQKLFERVFHTTLVTRRGRPPQAGESTVYYEAAEPIQVPQDLSALVAAVSLPVPPELYRAGGP